LGAYVILVPGLGVLIIGVVMIGSVFGKGSAYLGVGTGVAAIVAVVGPFAYEPLESIAILTAVLTLVWILVVGIRLRRLA
jgi:hypothetical protein